MPPIITVVLGKSIRFLCAVKSISGIEVTFQWSKYFKPIVPNPHVTVTRTDSKDDISSTSDQRGHLKITGVRYSDTGLYTCQIVGNKKVIASKDVLLKVKGKLSNLFHVPVVDVHHSYGCNLYNLFVKWAGSSCYLLAPLKTTYSHSVHSASQKYKLLPANCWGNL